MTKGQRAMAVATISPVPERGGRGRKSSKMEGFPSGAHLSRARTVLRYAPDLSANVLGGTSLRLGVGTVTQIRTRSLVLKRLQQLAGPTHSPREGLTRGRWGNSPPEGRARERGEGGQELHNGPDIPEKMPGGDAREKAADAFGTNPRYVSAAPSQTAMASPSCAHDRSHMIYLAPDELTPAAECGHRTSATRGRRRSECVDRGLCVGR